LNTVDTSKNGSVEDSLGWVLDEGVELVAPVPVVGEALEVDDEDARQLPQVKLLGGALVLLAAWTVPAKQKLTMK
jgi:hypothetical protein